MLHFLHEKIIFACENGTLIRQNSVDRDVDVQVGGEVDFWDHSSEAQKQLYLPEKARRI